MVQSTPPQTDLRKVTEGTWQEQKGTFVRCNDDPVFEIIDGEVNLNVNGETIGIWDEVFFPKR